MNGALQAQADALPRLRCADALAAVAGAMVLHEREVPGSGANARAETHMISNCQQDKVTL